MSIFGTIDTPVPDFWWCLLWISKPEWAVLFALCGGIHDVHFLLFTSGATFADLLMANMAASSFPHIRVSVEVSCRTRTESPFLKFDADSDTDVKYEQGLAWIEHDSNS